MHICYIADGRSPTTQNWVSYFAGSGRHQVTVISSYPCASDVIPDARIIEFPFALSSSSPGSASGKPKGISSLARTVLRSGPLSTASDRLRSWIAPLDIRRKTEAMAALIDRLQPDIVHAMRLPYEGYLAAAAVRTAPLLISVWGNDFTLFADRSRRLSELTNQVLARADALHCDCRRDLQIAFRRGFSQSKPWRVLPGNGGIHTDAYFKIKTSPSFLRKHSIPEGPPLIVNPRGFRSYVRNDVFFRAIALTLQQVPNAIFVAVGMAGNPLAKRWAKRSGAKDSIRLLPLIPREQLADLFVASQVSVSPSSHDGTPNTLLEAMACGCFPVVGNVDSVREWIVNGENGLICDETEAVSLADCIIRALHEPSLRKEAAEINRRVVRTRAEYSICMAEAERLYEATIGKSRLAVGAD